MTPALTVAMAKEDASIGAPKASSAGFGLRNHNAIGTHLHRLKKGG